MRATSVTCKVLMWTVLVVCTAFQVLAMIGIGQNNTAAAEAGKPEKIYALWPLIAVMALLWGAVLLFTLLHKHPHIGIILAGVAGIAAIVIAFDLMRAFPSQISASGGDTGLSTAKMVYRHMSPILVPILMIPAWILDRILDKQAQARLVASGKARFDLSGAPIFSDGSTLGLAMAADGPEESPRKEKRSIRAARRKQERY